MFWLMLLILLLAMSIGGSVYLVKRIHHFSFIERLAKKHRLISWIICILPIVGIMSISIFNFFTAIIILVHFSFFWLVIDIGAAIIRKVTKKKWKRNFEGAVAIVFTAFYFAVGWYNAHHIDRTEYNLNTEKPLDGGSLRIVGIADSHFGITLDGEKFAAQIDRIQKENPDIVVVAGDFVDDDCRRADMVRACEALGSLHTRYGVFFIYGNHDKGYIDDYRDFSSDELHNELLRNNVVILEDDVQEISDNLCIIGRKDKSIKDRMEMNDIVRNTDNSKYTLVLDHQPNDFANEAAAGVDLVFSGHTHAGHIWPAGQIAQLTKMNDLTYGLETRGNTHFIVTSGISGWAIPFKTGAGSEYVVINIKN